MKWILLASPVFLVVGCTDDSAKPAVQRQGDKPLASFELALRQKSPELLNRYWMAVEMARVHCSQDLSALALEREKRAALCSAHTAASSDLRQLGISRAQLGQLSEFGVAESTIGGEGRKSLSLVYYEPNYVGPFRSPEICAKAERNVRAKGIRTVACREWRP